MQTKLFSTIGQLLFGSRLNGIGSDFTSRQSRSDSLSIVSRQSVLAILLLCLTLGVGTAWGTEEVYKKCIFHADSVTTGTGNYTSTLVCRNRKCSATWSAVNANNNSNNTAWNYIKMGPKKSNKSDPDKVVTGYIKTGISGSWESYSEPITKVVVYGSKLRGSISAKLIYASNSSYTTDKVESSALTAFSDGKMTFSIASPTASRYYQIEITCTNTSTTAGVIQIDSVEYYHSASCSDGTITYSAGSTTYTGGNTISGSHASDTKVCSTNLTLPGATFTTTGYTQDGWATSDGGSKVYNLSATNYSTEGDATLYPHWSANNYTVTWMSNGSQHTTTSVSYGSKPTFPSNPSSCDATSDTFYGWTTAAWTGALDDVSAKTIYTSAASMPAVTGAVTYYAVFAKETTSSDTYIKGTSADLTEGQTVVIVNNYYEVALSSEESGNGYDAVSLSISSNKFTSSNTSILWTVEVGSSGFYFKQGDNYINASPDNKGNHYLWFDEYSDEWTLTGSGPYVLYSTEDDGYQMEYYYSSDYFTTYTGTSGNAYYIDFYIPEVTYSKYLTNCCTNLGYINGSIL